jgi:hypothetical protein
VLPHHPSRPHSTLRPLAVVLALALALLGTANPVPAGADSLIDESFTGASIGAPGWVTGGTGGASTGWPGGACLTAGTNTSAAPGPGCGLDSPDTVGQGVLRLTPREGSRTGYALYNNSLPTRYGIDFSFKLAEWGVFGGADGVSVFFVKGTSNLVQPGGAGGNLGYVGIADGLLGVAFDSYGSYSSYNNPGCGDAPGFERDQIGIRGPGNSNGGYCWLGGTGELDEYLSGVNREDSTISVRVVVDPDTVSQRKVTITYERGGPDPISGQLQVDLPADFINEPTFKFGFAGSTGADNNNHEIWDVKVASVNPVPPTPIPPTPDPVDPGTGPAVAPVAVTPKYTG